ncbi:MAG: HAD family phosphatase [Halanaerobiales bacterium]|nr:HAD family phosphatase [Halanaerobiales bacterium]
MSYRLIAIDMDDTLLGDDLKIGSRTKERIQLAREAGVKVVIATGRMFQAIVPYIQELDLKEPAIVYNGALVQRFGDRDSLVHYPIPLKFAKRIASRVENAGSQLNAYIDDKLYVRARTPEVLYYMERTKVDSIEVGPIANFLQAPPTKLLVIHRNLQEINQLKEELQEEFGEDLSITGSKSYFIEITASGISKGAALAELTKKMGISSREVIAIGDGLNDLTMVKWAGLGVAVQNAHPDLRKAADYVTSSCDEEGVAQVIDQFILQMG